MWCSSSTRSCADGGGEGQSRSLSSSSFSRTKSFEETTCSTRLDAGVTSTPEQLLPSRTSSPDEQHESVSPQHRSCADFKSEQEMLFSLGPLFSERSMHDEQLSLPSPRTRSCVSIDDWFPNSASFVTSSAIFKASVLFQSKVVQQEGANL